MDLKRALPLAIAVLVSSGCNASTEPTKTEEQTFRNPQRTMPAGAAPGSNAAPTAPVTGGK